MTVRALGVILVAAAAFFGFYAIGQAGDDDGDATDLVAPAAIEEDMDQEAGPPELEAGGRLPSLKPAGRQAAAPTAAPAPSGSGPSPSSSAPAAPAPAAPTPAPAPTEAPAPAPAPPSDGGQPFYDDG